MIPKLIGAHLKSVRIRHGLNQVTACKHLGITQSALSRVESGKQTLSAEQWLKFIFKIGAEDDLWDAVKDSIGKKRKKAA